MTSTELIVIVGGALLGYWMVAVLIPAVFGREKGNKADPDKPSPEDATDRFSYRQEEQTRSKPDTEQPQIRHWFDILEVSESASRDQIVGAYKKMIRQYHPDKVAQMGADIRGLAEARSKEINTAYDAAMKLR